MYIKLTIESYKHRNGTSFLIHRPSSVRHHQAEMDASATTDWATPLVLNLYGRSLHLAFALAITSVS